MDSEKVDLARDRSARPHAAGHDHFLHNSGRRMWTRALILSEIRLYRDALCKSLAESADVEVVGSSDLENAVEQTQRLAPDVLVLDATAPDAAALARSLREARPDLCIVVVTSARDEAELLAWAETGVNGYADRNSSAADLVAAVLHAARGEVLCSPRVVALLAGRVAKLSAERRRSNELDSLTPRERDVLTLVAEGLSNKRIALRLGISETTTKNHVHNILDKLGQKSRGLAAAYYLRLRPSMKPGSSPIVI